MMNVVIIEDEKLTARRLESMLLQYDSIHSGTGPVALGE